MEEGGMEGVFAMEDEDGFWDPSKHAMNTRKNLYLGSLKFFPFIKV